jgi:hypothetical protein
MIDRIIARCVHPRSLVRVPGCILGKTRRRPTHKQLLAAENMRGTTWPISRAVVLNECRPIVVR